MRRLDRHPTTVRVDMTGAATRAVPTKVPWRDRTPLALLIGALSLRMLALGSKSLWSDEAFSWWHALLGPAEIWARNGDPHHPPLYYIVLSWVVPISDSEFALRFPSALASALTVLFVYLLARRLTDSFGGALLAGVLVALSPLDVWYAQEARQAAMGTFLMVAASYGLIRRDGIGRLIGVVSLTGAFFSYYVTLAVWAALLGVGTYIFWKERKPFLREWVIVSAPSVAVFAVLQGEHFVSGFASLLSLADRPFVNALMSVGAGPASVLVVGALGAFVGAVVVHKLMTTWPRALGALGITAYVAAMAVPFLERGYSLQRVILVAWPFAIVMVAYAAVQGFSREGVRAIGWVVGALALAASLATVFMVPKDDWRSAIAVINDHAAADDVIWMVDHPRNWEAPRGAYHVVEWGTAPYEYYGARLPLLREDDESRFPDLVATVGGDIWVVGARTPRDEVPNPGGEAWLDENWNLEEEFEMHRRAVRRYSRP